jgi:predicted DNA-binding protein (MmcQ/YjbR family)
VQQLIRGFDARVSRFGPPGRRIFAMGFGCAWFMGEWITGRKMATKGAQQQITHAVTQWPEVTTAPHRFGGVEYLLGTREIGHIHGDTLVDIPFPTAVRDELVNSGQASPHHILPDSGWISFYIHTREDVERALRLLQKSYDLARQQAARRKAGQKADDDTHDSN